MDKGKAREKARERMKDTAILRKRNPAIASCGEKEREGERERKKERRRNSALGQLGAHTFTPFYPHHRRQQCHVNNLSIVGAKLAIS